MTSDGAMAHPERISYSFATLWRLSEFGLKTKLGIFNAAFLSLLLYGYKMCPLGA